MSDFIVSFIRTNVPVLVGLLAALAAKEGVNVDSDLLTAALSGMCIAVYYGVARKLEERNPQFGILLGVRKAPEYTAP